MPQTFSAELLKAMIHADRASAAMLIDRALAEGISPAGVVNDVLDPALHQLGELWGSESLSLAQGFVAGRIAEDALLRCLSGTAAASPQVLKGPVVIGNIEDDYHSLGRRIVVSFLRATGWEVHDLGNDVLAEQFLEKALEVRASVVGASAMMQTTALNIRKLRELIDARGLNGRLKLAVGGAVFNWRPDLVAEVGGDGTARNATGVDELFLRLQAEAKGGPTA